MPTFAELIDEFIYDPSEDSGDLVPLSASTALPPQALEEVPREHLAFLLEGETYAVPIEDVVEVLKVPPLTEVPRTELRMLGLMNLRGDILPVYDVKVRLRLAVEVPRGVGREGGGLELPRGARVVVVRGEDMAMGFLVDGRCRVVRLRVSSLEAPPAGVVGERDSVVALAREEGRLVLVLDTKRLLE